MPPLSTSPAMPPNMLVLSVALIVPPEKLTEQLFILPPDKTSVAIAPKVELLLILKLETVKKSILTLSTLPYKVRTSGLYILLYPVP